MMKSALICVVVILGLVTLAVGQQALAGNLRQDERQGHHPQVLRGVHGRPQDLRRRGAVQTGLARRSRNRGVPHGLPISRSRASPFPRATTRSSCCPTPEWQLIISKQTGPQAATYNPKMDLGPGADGHEEGGRADRESQDHGNEPGQRRRQARDGVGDHHRFRSLQHRRRQGEPRVVEGKRPSSRMSRDEEPT